MILAETDDGRPPHARVPAGDAAHQVQQDRGILTAYGMIDPGEVIVRRHRRRLGLDLRFGHPASLGRPTRNSPVSGDGAGKLKHDVFLGHPDIFLRDVEPRLEGLDHALDEIFRG